MVFPLIEPALHSLDKTIYYNRLYQSLKSDFVFIFGVKKTTIDICVLDRFYPTITFIKILKDFEKDKINELTKGLSKYISSNKGLKLIYEIHVIDNNYKLVDKVTITL